MCREGIRKTGKTKQPQRPDADRFGFAKAAGGNGGVSRSAEVMGVAFAVRKTEPAAFKLQGGGVTDIPPGGAD